MKPDPDFVIPRYGVMPNFYDGKWYVYDTHRLSLSIPNTGSYDREAVQRIAKKLNRRKQ
jgi:hypothetical protein